MLLTCRNGEDLSLWSKDDLANDASLIQRDDSQAASLASTATFVSTSGPTPSSVASGAVTSSLLLDGSRAIEAVCRPFPIALVGRPERIDFDIRTSVFKLSVRVGPSDAPARDGAKSEIYLPYIHYAASLASTGDAESSRSSTPTSTGKGTTEHAVALALDVDITTSTGTTTTKGQTLYWTYDVPQTERVITLQVKRRGGAIRRATTTGAQGAGGSWADVCGNCTIA